MFRKETSPEPEISGAEALRRTLITWKNRPHVWSTIVRDTAGLSPQMLDNFAAGKAELSVELLAKLTKVMFNGHAVFDPATMKLKTAYQQPPVSMGIAPEPYRTPNDFVLPVYGGGPQPEQPKQEKVSMSRPGWTGEFYPVKIAEPDHKPREPFVRAPPER